MRQYNLGLAYDMQRPAQHTPFGLFFFFFFSFFFFFFSIFSNPLILYLTFSLHSTCIELSLNKVSIKYSYKTSKHFSFFFFLNGHFDSSDPLSYYESSGASSIRPVSFISFTHSHIIRPDKFIFLTLRILL